MVELKPLIVITGTIHVEGGINKRTRSKPKRDGNKLTVVEDREISAHRRAANVIVTDYMRKLRGLRLLRTPYGTLVDPTSLAAVKELIDAATKEVEEFNRSARGCELSCTLLWETLKGNRAEKVAEYIERKLHDEDKEVTEALAALMRKSAAA